jgi:hypothetical protein
MGPPTGTRAEESTGDALRFFWFYFLKPRVQHLDVTRQLMFSGSLIAGRLPNIWF